MEHAGAANGLRRYLIGFALALILTAVPFALVATHALPRGVSLAVIAVAAIAQVVVQLRYFLRMGLRSTPRENLLATGFAAILIFIMIGGSMLIMFNLHYRMGA